MKAGLIALLVAGVGLFAACESYESVNSDTDLGDGGGNPTNIAEENRETSGGGETSGVDGLPAGTQWIYGSDISGWDETINLSWASIRHKRGNEYTVLVQYDRLPEIPAWHVPGDPNNVHNVNGSIWLAREYQGQWYIGTIDYLRVGQMAKDFHVGHDVKMTPQPGDRIGVLVSTVNRSYNGTVVTGDPNSPYRERSNVYWLTW